MGKPYVRKKEGKKGTNEISTNGRQEIMKDNYDTILESILFSFQEKIKLTTLTGIETDENCQ